MKFLLEDYPHARMLHQHMKGMVTSDSIIAERTAQSSWQSLNAFFPFSPRVLFSSTSIVFIHFLLARHITLLVKRERENELVLLDLDVYFISSDHVNRSILFVLGKSCLWILRGNRNVQSIRVMLLLPWCFYRNSTSCSPDSGFSFRTCFLISSLARERERESEEGKKDFPLSLAHPRAALWAVES